VSDAPRLAGLIADRLEGEAERLREAWRAPAGTQTRHFVIDGLLPESDARAVAAAFPGPEAAWRRLDTFRERKSTFAKLDAADPLIEAATDAFHDPRVVAAVAGITGLEDLEPDPELYAGGVSAMGPGDFLNPHIDNSHDAERRRYRRLNLLWYATPGWTAEQGGALELWDKTVRKPVAIPSGFNRLIVMETGPSTWHSVSPVTGPGERRCVSNYFFSTASPTGRSYHHVTSFLGRPNQPMRRIAGRADNALRQAAASVLGRGRGRELGRGRRR